MFKDSIEVLNASVDYSDQLLTKSYLCQSRDLRKSFYQPLAAIKQGGIPIKSVVMPNSRYLPVKNPKLAGNLRMRGDDSSTLIVSRNAS